jgi:hypothetical protein
MLASTAARMLKEPTTTLARLLVASPSVANALVPTSVVMITTGRPSAMPFVRVRSACL